MQPFEFNATRRKSLDYMEFGEPQGHASRSGRSGGAGLRDGLGFEAGGRQVRTQCLLELAT